MLNCWLTMCEVQVVIITLNNDLLSVSELLITASEPAK